MVPGFFYLAQTIDSNILLGANEALVFTFKVLLVSFVEEGFISQFLGYHYSRSQDTNIFMA